MLRILSSLGNHNWDPIVGWPEAIGSIKRSFISSIAIDVTEPDYAWQRSNGERVADPGTFTPYEVYPRNPYLHLPIDRTYENLADTPPYPRDPYLQLQVGGRRVRYSRVDNINPVMERIFILLGQRKSEQRLNMTMLLLCPGLYPGVRSPRDEWDTDPDDTWYSMDLPNLVEKFRSLHTPQGQVQVLWEGHEGRVELEKRREILQHLGWIVKVLETTQDIFQPSDFPDMPEERMAKFVLRSKEVTGIVWAQYPCPFNHLMPGNMAQYG